MGMVSKYTPERVETILKALRKGVSRETAAKMAGINPCTFHRWCKERPEFKAEVDKTDAAREQYLVGLIEEYALKDWRAASFLLKSRYKGWSDAKTSQENRDLMDRLKVMEQALAVKFQALRIQQVTMGNEDYDIIEILNEVHGIEEKFDGEGIRLERKSEGEGGEAINEVPDEKEKKVVH